MILCETVSSSLVSVLGFGCLDVALESLEQWSPKFLTPGTCLLEGNFSADWSQGERYRIIQVHYTCALYYYYYYYISSISNHQALDPRGWGPLL